MNLIKELKNNAQLLNEDKEFPIPLNSKHSFKLIEISKIKCYCIDNKLVFVIYIAITTNTLYDLYHLIPLPIPYENSNGTFAYIQPDHKYLAMSHNKMTYVPFKDISKCLVLNENELICEAHIIYSTIEEPICEVSLIDAKSKIPNNCNANLIHGKLSIWHSLKYNQWIYVLSEISHLTISCENFNIHDEEISKTGLLTLNANCKAYSDSNLLLPTNKLTSKYINIIPTTDCCEINKKNKTIENIQLSPVKLTNLNLDDLNLANHKLNQFNEQISNLMKEPNIVRYQTWYTTILGVLISIIGIIVLYRIAACIGLLKMFKCCFSSNTRKDRECCIQIFNQCTNRSPSHYKYDYNQTELPLQTISSEQETATTNSAEPMASNIRSERSSSRRSVSRPKDSNRVYPDD